MVLIVQPLGRFGNNVIQLIHAIHIAETFHIPAVRFRFGGFQTNEIRIHDLRIRANRNHPLRRQRIVHNFFYEHQNLAIFPGLSNLSPHDRLRIAQQYLKPILSCSSELPFLPDFETTLFVHIRSGDLFRNHSPHSSYIQPPLDYYTYIFSRECDKNVVVLYEDDGNPVVNALKVSNPTYAFYSLPIEETFYIFLHAKYIVMGYGTFVPGILCMNDSYHTLYCPGNFQAGVPNCISVPLPDYIQKWENTEEQRSFMLTYNGITKHFHFLPDRPADKHF